jgi:hypothetical protein
MGQCHNRGLNFERSDDIAATLTPIGSPGMPMPRRRHRRRSVILIALVTAGLTIPLVALRVPPDWDALSLPTGLWGCHDVVIDEHQRERAWLQGHIVALETEVDALALELTGARGDQSVARARNAQLEQRLDEPRSRTQELSTDPPSMQLRNGESGLFPLDWVK